MSDQWKDFWVSAKHGYVPEVNLRPKTYDTKGAFQHLDHILHFQKKDEVLDVGSGNGLMAQEVSSSVTQVTCIDYSPNMIQLVNGLGVRNVVGLTGDARQIPFYDEMFDKVYSLSVIQYMESLDEVNQCIQEMLRVCRKGGGVVIGDVIDPTKMTEIIPGMFSFLPEQVRVKGVRHEGFYEKERRYDLYIQKGIVENNRASG